MAFVASIVHQQVGSGSSGYTTMVSPLLLLSLLEILSLFSVCILYEPIVIVFLSISQKLKSAS